MSEKDKTVQAYLDSLGDLSDANPVFAGAIKLIQDGLQNQFNDQENKLTEQSLTQ